MTKLKLDFFYVITNSYTKFQVNFSKDGREKSGKLNDRESEEKGVFECRYTIEYESQ